MIPMDDDLQDGPWMNFRHLPGYVPMEAAPSDDRGIVEGSDDSADSDDTDSAAPETGQLSPGNSFSDKVRRLTDAFSKRRELADYVPGVNLEDDPTAKLVKALMAAKPASPDPFASAGSGGFLSGGISRGFSAMPTQDISPNAGNISGPKTGHDDEEEQPDFRDDFIDGGRGAAYRQDQLHRRSHYNDEIKPISDRLAGNSRIWGDAPPATKRSAVQSLIDAANAAELNARDTAHVLAIAHLESGFNPDAAAGTSTATGLGQFLDPYKGSFGLDEKNRWDADAQSRALVKYFLKNKATARQRGQGEEYIYKYHHDGPTQEHGGLAIARNKGLMDRVAYYEQLLKQR